MIVLIHDTNFTYFETGPINKLLDVFKDKYSLIAVVEKDNPNLPIKNVRILINPVGVPIPLDYKYFGHTSINEYHCLIFTKETYEKQHDASVSAQNVLF